MKDSARIKVWPGAPAAMSTDLQGGGGSGLVKNITYDGMTVDNVDYAIKVTQCYGQKNLTLCNEFPVRVHPYPLVPISFHSILITAVSFVSGCRRLTHTPPRANLSSKILSSRISTVSHLVDMTLMWGRLSAQVPM